MLMECILLLNSHPCSFVFFSYIFSCFSFTIFLFLTHMGWQICIDWMVGVIVGIRHWAAPYWKPFQATVSLKSRWLHRLVRLSYIGLFSATNAPNNDTGIRHIHDHTAKCRAPTAAAITNNFDECIDKQLIFHHGTILLQCVCSCHSHETSACNNNEDVDVVPTNKMHLHLDMYARSREEYVNDKIN